MSETNWRLLGGLVGLLVALVFVTVGRMISLAIHG